MTGRILCRLALTLLCLAWVRPAEASCVYMGPVCQTWRTYDAIFDGTVVSIERMDRDEEMGAGRIERIGHRLVTFEVHESWRGVVGERTRMLLWGGRWPEGGRSTSNDFHVEVGKRYVIFGHRTPDGYLSTSSCSPSRTYEASLENLAFLRSLREPGKGARIFGELFLFNRSSREPTMERVPVAATVRITGPDTNQSLQPKDNRFELTGLKPGNYVVAVLGPSLLEVPGPILAVLPDAHACHAANFYFQHRAAITGRLVDASGKPLRMRRIQLADAATWQQDPMSPLTEYTQDGGQFSFKGLPPGSYIVGVNLRDNPGQGDPEERVLYPGRGLEPQAVHVAPGEELALGTLQLGPPLPEVPLALRLTWEGGLPIANHAVSLEDVTGGHWPNRSRPVANTRTDTGGIVRVSGRGTRTYVARVWTHGRGGPTEVGRSAPFPAESAAKGLTLVVEPIR